MASYRVTVKGTFQDEFTFDAYDERDAEAVALEEFRSTYRIVSGSDWQWDNCEVTLIEEVIESQWMKLNTSN